MKYTDTEDTHAYWKHSKGPANESTIQTRNRGSSLAWSGKVMFNHSREFIIATTSNDWFLIFFILIFILCSPVTTEWLSRIFLTAFLMALQVLINICDMLICHRLLSILRQKVSGCSKLHSLAPCWAGICKGISGTVEHRTSPRTQANDISIRMNPSCQKLFWLLWHENEYSQTLVLKQLYLKFGSFNVTIQCNPAALKQFVMSAQ